MPGDRRPRRRTHREHRDDDRVAAWRPASPDRAVQALEAEPGRQPQRPAVTGPGRIDQHHDQAPADVAESVRFEPRDQVVGRVVRRRRPDVWLAHERRERDQQLAQAAIERRRVGRPPEGLRSIPERLGVDRIDQHDRVPQVPDLTSRQARGHGPRGRGADASSVRPPRAAPHRSRPPGNDTGRGDRRGRRRPAATDPAGDPAARRGRKRR